MLALLRAGRNLARLLQIGYILARHDALFMLAQCQTDIQAWNEAKNTYRTLIRRFPDSHFVPESKMNLSTLQLTH